MQEKIKPTRFASRASVTAGKLAADAVSVSGRQLCRAAGREASAGGLQVLRRILGGGARCFLEQASLVLFQRLHAQIHDAQGASALLLHRPNMLFEQKLELSAIIQEWTFSFILVLHHIP